MVICWFFEKIKCLVFFIYQLPKVTNMLKVGIIGCGKMGMHHFRAIQTFPSVQIVGLVDPVINHDNISGLVPDKTPIYPDAETLLIATDPDVVHITTPPGTHAALAKLALQHNAHVYVEKPFVNKEEEALELVALAEDRKLKLCPGHQVLYQKPAKRAFQCLFEIGQVVHIESYFSFRTVRKNISPVDQLIDILPHPTYVLLDFLRASGNQGNQPATLTGLDVRPSGEVRAVLRSGEVSAVLVVTLRGRPVQSYLRIVGTNGLLHVDFVRGTIIKLLGPGSSIFSVLMNPYSESWQIATRSTVSFAQFFFQKRKSYPGLADLIHSFYTSIQGKSPVPFTPTSIIETVGVCERISKALRVEEKEQESKAREAILHAEQKLTMNEALKPVLVTGGTGFLGRVLVKKLREAGWPVRVISRREVPYSMRMAGVEYCMADLTRDIPQNYFHNVDTIIHCAAETAGGKELHALNTLASTRNILKAAAENGVTKLIHTSSLAVLKPSREVGGPLTEDSPVDKNNPSRGPYVTAKAESEHIARELGKELGVSVRTIRLGPLVDYGQFQAPGRLGREIGRFFIAMGSPGSQLSVCDLDMAAAVIVRYLTDFDRAPEVLNLVDPVPPSRRELVQRMKAARPDLRVIWMPWLVLRSISFLLKLVQRIIRSNKPALDLCAAFSSENYQTKLAFYVTEITHEAKNK